MITLVVFVMMRSIPGDPVVALLGDAYTEDNAIKVRHEYGLDRPIPVQYVIWLGKLVQGDWGTSILSGRPVLKDVVARLPVTLELIVLSMVVALAIAIPAAIIELLGEHRARHGGRMVDEIREVSPDEARAAFPPLARPLRALHDRAAARVDGRLLNESLLERQRGGV